MPETFIVPVSGAPDPGRGAMVVPSGIAQVVMKKLQKFVMLF
jgi:hypothetical protein